MVLTKTGIAGFDEFLQGGLPPRILLLVGVPCSGHEVFARQTAFAKAKQTGVTYFTVKSVSESIKEDMLSFGWDITPLEKNGLWKFINLSDSEPIVQAVLQEAKKRRCIVVDSLSELLLTEKIEEVIDLLTSLTAENRENQELHLMLLTEGMQDKKIETTMEHFAEGVISFNTDLTGDFANRDLLIKKMRGTLIPSRKLPYKIGIKGLVMETAIRIT